MPPSSLLRIDGVALSLRLVVPEDAGYLHNLRLDARYNTHLSSVTGTVCDQENWIREYKGREAEAIEYYYVIERRKDLQRCGLVRLYGISADHFTWGSWILDENKPHKAALESAVLSFKVGFHHLGLDVAEIDVRNDNFKARAFYERLGMTYLRHDHRDSFYEYTNARFTRDIEHHMQVIKAAHET